MTWLWMSIGVRVWRWPCGSMTTRGCSFPLSIRSAAGVPAVVHADVADSGRLQQPAPVGVVDLLVARTAVGRLADSATQFARPTGVAVDGVRWEQDCLPLLSSAGQKGDLANGGPRTDELHIRTGRIKGVVAGAHKEPGQ